MLEDLYFDLRDRHLLPLVALLVVAIIAAPILLNGSDGDKRSAATVNRAVGGEVADSAFAVVPAEQGLRSPRKRFRHRKPLDPFRSPASGPGTAVAEIEAAVAAAESSIGGSSSSGAGGSSSVESAPVESAAPEAAAAESATPEASPSSGSEGSTTTTESTNVVVQHEVVGYSVSMKAGNMPGTLKKQTEVASMTKLPSAKNPVVMFVGLSKNHKRALFLMTSRVTAYYGSGHCAIDKQACQMVEVKPGKSVSFGYGYGQGARRYKIVVGKVEPVVETRKKSAQKTTKTKRSHLGASGSESASG